MNTRGMGWNVRKLTLRQERWHWELDFLPTSVTASMATQLLDTTARYHGGHICKLCDEGYHIKEVESRVLCIESDSNKPGLAIMVCVVVVFFFAVNMLCFRAFISDKSFLAGRRRPLP
mmetsp:Transcript_71957/g.127169  ORF Transcript_71957/g.127169 Transcript_71957/m.127169 type:complete len:118 (-) Transcript_71957:61-414(-)